MKTTMPGLLAAILASVLVCQPKAVLSGEPSQEATATSTRDIKDRFVPPVAGIDLEQALNYTDSEGARPRVVLPLLHLPAGVLQAWLAAGPGKDRLARDQEGRTAHGKAPGCASPW